MHVLSRTAGWLTLPVLAMSVAAGSARAQDSTKALAVGQQAPDFTAVGATRFGVLKDPIKLSDFRGQTVVLAFFFKARTKG
jgi:peroxiredoxin Q/BCP